MFYPFWVLSLSGGGGAMQNWFLFCHFVFIPGLQKHIELNVHVLSKPVHTSVLGFFSLHLGNRTENGKICFKYTFELLSVKTPQSEGNLEGKDSGCRESWGLQSRTLFVGDSPSLSVLSQTCPALSGTFLKCDMTGRFES